MPSVQLRRGSKGGSVVAVRVITYAPTAFAHCQHCEVAFGEIGLGERIRREAVASALPEDLALEFARVSDWVRRLVDHYGPRVHVELVDAASIEGFVRSLRHRIWRHPAIVVDGHAVVGDDYAAAERLIDRELERQSPPALGGDSTPGPGQLSTGA